MADSTLGTIASAIPVVGSVVSGLINNAATNSANAKSRDFTQQMYNQQKSDNLDMWNMQNAYNAPSAQMQRYADAGLNPNLIYGSATNNVAAPLKAPDAQPYHPAPANGLAAVGTSLGTSMQTFLNAQMVQAQTNLVQAQKLNTDQESLLKNSQTANTDVNTADKSFDLGLKSDLRDNSLQYAQAQTKRESAQADLLLGDNARAAIAQTWSIKEAVARIASMALQNAHTTADRLRIQAETAKIATDTDMDKADLALKIQGIQPHDGMWNRAVGGFLSQFGILPNGKSQTQPLFRTPKSWSNPANNKDWMPGF